MRKVPYPEGDWRFVNVVKPGNLLKHIEFNLLRLEPNDVWEFGSETKECVFILLSGHSIVEHGSDVIEFGPRRDVFSSKAHAIYLPVGDSLRVKSIYPTEIAVACASAENRFEFTVVRPEEVRVRIVGELNWRRHVHDIVTDNVKAEKLLVGETFNPPGNWSSYPPHKHDVHDPPFESEMEEIYHFRISPKGGFGAQFLYTEDGSVDEIVKIEDGITVIIDRGYHPVVAAPGYQIYYLWVLAGRERILIPKDDPRHSWIRAMEASVKNW